MAMSLSAAARKEWFLGVSLATCAVFFLYGHDFWSGSQSVLLLAFVWLFVAVLGSTLSVVRHADHLAELLGEPYGTLILTLAVTAIEVVSISAMMLRGANHPSLMSDTIFAVLMITLNAMVGLTLIIGAWRHREQQYNLQGANAYLGVIIPVAVLGMILPNFTQTTPGPTLSSAQETFLVLISIALYATFLGIQTGRHRGYFTLLEGKNTEHGQGAEDRANSLLGHSALLAAFMFPVVFLADELAHPLNALIETSGAPTALGGIAIAVLVATPEAIGAIRAAVKNHLQRSVNILLGSVLSTISLTIPAMIMISHFTGQPIVLGLQHGNLVMLVLTLTVSVVTFASGRTNVLQGVVHFLLFLAYLLLVFQG
jgi:Ca2+:H+ antiporter